MEKSTENLKLIAAYFEIKNKNIADALNVHTSQVSRWMNGERALRLDSEYMEPLIDFIISRDLSSNDIKWIKQKFESSGIKSDFSSISDIKLGLMLWIASDSGEKIRGILGSSNEVNGSLSLEKIKGAFNPQRIYNSNYAIKTGITEISLYLGTLFCELDSKSTVNIYISGNDSSVITNETFFSTLQNAIDKFDINFRILICVSNKKSIVPNAITVYLNQIVNGSIELLTINTDDSPFAIQTTIIIPDRCAVVITELAQSIAPAAAIIIYERTFLRDAQNNFNKLALFAQPLFTSFIGVNRQYQNIYNSSYFENGDLFIIRDGISPLYMSLQSYKDFLRSRGHEGDAFNWRSEQFKNLKTALEENLKKGMCIKEIVSLSSWEKIAKNKNYTMPGELLFDIGEIKIDQKFILDMLDGYVRYMKIYPKFALRFTDGLDKIHQNSEWHIKESHHVLINKIDLNDSPHLYSSQPMFIYAIKNYFDTKWQELNYYSIGNTHALIMLNNEITQIKAQLKNDE